MSEGRPTKLVRDGAVESYDEPPAGPPVRVPTVLEPEPVATGGEDLIRADGAQHDPAYDKDQGALAAFDIVAQTGPGQLVTLPTSVTHPKRKRN